MSTVSIALCTYNGEKYLPEQLLSYARQSRLPDELVVCDDASTDTTFSILETFARTLPFPVRLYVNPTNVGYVKNFENAIEKCTGDIIFFSDQDDVWHVEKISAVTEVFEKDPNVGLTYANAEVVDRDLRPMDRTLWERLEFTEKCQKIFAEGNGIDLLLLDGYTPGSSLAFRARFKHLILPIPDEIYFTHDNWTSLCVAAVSKTAIVSKELIKYRQHDKQTSGGAKSEPSSMMVTTKKAIESHNQFSGIIKQLAELRSRLEATGSLSKTLDLKICRAQSFLAFRNNLSKHSFRRTHQIVRQVFRGNYYKYANGIRSAVKDCVFGSRK